MTKLLQLYTLMFSVFEAVYRCVECDHEEQSSDITPKLMMQGAQASCTKCGAKTEAVWGHSTLPGYTSQPTGGAHKLGNNIGNSGVSGRKYIHNPVRGR